MTDTKGRILDGRARSFFCRSPIGAEAEGLLAAVELVGVEPSGTIIYTDSQTVYQCLFSQHDQWPWEIASTVAKIHHALAGARNVQVKKVDRIEVKLADRVAKMMRDGVFPTNWLYTL
ncbi:hypothetical protein LINPERHAP2_LOCUS39608 [Linum perenne]